MMSEEKNSYEVGYGKPPKKRQWKDGQSGNPKGRPRGSVNKKTFEALLREQADNLLYETQKQIYDDSGVSKYGLKPKRRRRV